MLLTMYLLLWKPLLTNLKNRQVKAVSDNKLAHAITLIFTHIVLRPAKPQTAHDYLSTSARVVFLSLLYIIIDSESNNVLRFLQVRHFWFAVVEHVVRIPELRPRSARTCFTIVKMYRPPDIICWVWFFAWTTYKVSVGTSTRCVSKKFTRPFWK